MGASHPLVWEGSVFSHAKKLLAELGERQIQKRLGKYVGRHIIRLEVVHGNNLALVQISDIGNPALKVLGPARCSALLIWAYSIA